MLFIQKSKYRSLITFFIKKKYKKNSERFLGPLTTAFCVSGQAHRNVEMNRDVICGQDQIYSN